MECREITRVVGCRALSAACSSHVNSVCYVSGHTGSSQEEQHDMANGDVLNNLVDIEMSWSAGPSGSSTTKVASSVGLRAVRAHGGPGFPSPGATSKITPQVLSSQLQNCLRALSFLASLVPSIDRRYTRLNSAGGASSGARKTSHNTCNPNLRDRERM